MSPEANHNGTEQKWVAVTEVLGRDAERVLVRQLVADLGGNTSVRNASPLNWKVSGYYQRTRDW